ncbi:glycosyltransferase [Jatrophihabitans sp.]|uniref:glycosyltransferase n=1 Tax=Jatrophihabitans sp. TaxID=1932789 RepID=UPI0030C7578A|nr:Beta-monoglucosyldiacylglycerol synthase [Jatrophihabitans sp.]
MALPPDLRPHTEDPTPRRPDPQRQFPGESARDATSRLAMTALLMDNGLITAAQLEFALEEYRAVGDPLCDILVAHGMLTEDLRVAVLCQSYGLQQVSLVDDELDPAIIALLPWETSLAWHALPVARDADGVVLLAVARPLHPNALADIEDLLGCRAEQLLANRVELDRVLQAINAERLTELSINNLRDTAPELSGHIVSTPAQRGVMAFGVALVVVCALIWPVATMIAVIGVASAIYLLVSAYKFSLTLRALGTHLELDITDEHIAMLDEHLLPMYTILVPLYREGRVVRHLVEGLGELNYPRTRLDIKLLCEADDEETIAAIAELDLPPQFHTVVVPASLPKTKPKACNYGLMLASGMFCVIYDAEDRPEPNQLKKAVIAFSRMPENVICVQAKLNHFNQHQNILTACFANEYAMHFDLVLPAMAAAGSPIPLGGTSNHFLTEALRGLGAWDPYNVTEDADLGLRLHRGGFRTAMIDSTTLEEANSEVGNWIRQRSRWNKGYIQTWLVHMRHPFALLGQIGPRGFASLNLTLGSTFVLLMNPIFWFLTTLYAFTRMHLIQQVFPGVVFYIASALLFVGNFIFLFLNVAGGLHRGDFGLTRNALLSPLYWGLMSWAAWKGFIQLFTNPFYWEKTEHGLDDPNHPPTVRMRPTRSTLPEVAMDDLLWGEREEASA